MTGMKGKSEMPAHQKDDRVHNACFGWKLSGVEPLKMSFTCRMIVPCYLVIDNLWSVKMTFDV